MGMGWGDVPADSPSDSDAVSHVNIYKQLQAPKTPRGACRMFVLSTV
jgi:hypothetical protein